MDTMLVNTRVPIRCLDPVYVNLYGWFIQLIRAVNKICYSYLKSLLAILRTAVP